MTYMYYVYTWKIYLSDGNLLVTFIKTLYDLHKQSQKGTPLSEIFQTQYPLNKIGRQVM